MGLQLAELWERVIKREDFGGADKGKVAEGTTRAEAGTQI
jgi:hypothetical protein